jgi:hypothetical protein
MTAMQPAPISRIILMTGAAEAPFLCQVLHAYNPALDIATVTCREELATACKKPGPGTRLLSFCSPVIVPGDLLAGLPGPAYNFHPGPPERPGRYPGVFALYDNAPAFGVTVHEMVARVDSGPIVAAEWFEVQPAWDLGLLEEQTLIHLFTLFKRLAPHLAKHGAPLMRMPIAWQGRKTTKAQADALGIISPDMAPEEIARRRRACGNLFLKEA